MHLPVRPLVQAVQRLLLRTIPLQDAWQRFPHPVPLDRFGCGARHDFRWYFEGESRVRAATVADVQAWLEGCTYARDPELFHEPDVWQHPRTFELLRQGDCEDFAIWTWRKLVEIGYRAELVAGRLVQGGSATGHAWVLFWQGDEPHLFDPVVRDPARMIRPLQHARTDYVPEFAVDAAFNRYAFAGYYLRLRHEARRQPGWPRWLPALNRA